MSLIRSMVILALLCATCRADMTVVMFSKAAVPPVTQFVSDPAAMYSCDDNAANSTVLDATGAFEGTMNTGTTWAAINTSEHSSTNAKLGTSFSLPYNKKVGWVNGMGMANVTSNTVGFSVAAWVKFTDGRPAAGQSRGVFGAYNASPIQECLWFLGENTSAGRMTIILRDRYGTRNITSSEVMFPDGPTPWTHVAATIEYGSTNGILTYSNGVPNRLGNPSNLQAQYGTQIISTNPVHFGRVNDYSGYEACDFIDDFRLYTNKVLSGSEIRAIYNNGYGTTNVNPGY